MYVQGMNQNFYQCASKTRKDGDHSPGDGFAEGRDPWTGLPAPAVAGCPRFRTKLSANEAEKSTSEYGGAGGAAAVAAAAVGPQLSPLPADKARAAEEVEGGFELTPCVIKILRWPC